MATESGGISVFPSSLTPPYTVSPLELSFRDGEVEARGAVSDSMTVLEHHNLSVSRLWELDSILSLFVAKRRRKCGLVDRKSGRTHKIWIPDLKSFRNLSFSVAIMLCN